MVAVTTEQQDLGAALTQCLLDNSAMRGENAALRQSLQVNVVAVNDLFSRLLELENEHPWLTDALRRAERRCAELENRLVGLGDELDELRGIGQRCASAEAQLAHMHGELSALYRTKTMRAVTPLRKVWGLVRRVLEPER